MAASCNRAVATQAVAASVAAVAKAAANSGHAVVVPEAMHLKESLKEADFQKYSLIPLSINTEQQQVTESTAITSGEVLKQHTGEFGSICYVVRRPELAANENKPLEGFGLFGVVKETGVDDKGLSDFSTFYPYPLYKDEKLDFYKALGNRKVSLPLNPIKLVGGMFSLYGMQKRINNKKIEGNLTGEGLKQGGVILFDKDGSPMYAYYEKTGKELPVEDILAAIQAVKDDK